MSTKPDASGRMLTASSWSWRRTHTSSLWQKAGASAVNLAVVLTASAPVYITRDFETWRLATIALWWAYNFIFRQRCLGMMVMGTHLKSPANLRYITLYTASTATLFWWIAFPLDIALANGTMQLACIAINGGTLQSALSGQYTVREP